MRVGIGYDVHRLAEERKLILGGVEIPFKMGLLGHSDADVLAHAIIDALLGAVGLGDIGKHFPDTDSRFKGISSVLLLQNVGNMINSEGFQPHNIDAVIVAEQPTLASFISLMQENIARALEMKIDGVNVKATTTEGLGFAGTGKGIAAYAVATVKPIASVF